MARIPVRGAKAELDQKKKKRSILLGKLGNAVLSGTLRRTIGRLKVISTCKNNARYTGVPLKDIPELATLQGWKSNPQSPVEETLQRSMRACLGVTEIF